MDRNKVDLRKQSAVVLSLSARRAWIEMGYPASNPLKLSVVALRKESVDRNPVRVDAAGVARRRSPQGERG